MAKAHTKNTPKRDWHARFLSRLAKRANVSEAAVFAGVSRKNVYEHRSKDPEFAAAWEAAEQEAIDHLEKIAFERASKESDTLLIFLLKAHRREKYGERLTVTVLQQIQRRVTEMEDRDLLALLGYER